MGAYLTTETLHESIWSKIVGLCVYYVTIVLRRHDVCDGQTEIKKSIKGQRYLKVSAIFEI